MKTDYEQLAAAVRAITEGVPHEIANFSNTAALLWEHLPDINWVGFYKLEGEVLVLYPFQGKPACIEIPVGKGVCGTCIQERRVQRVEDVHKFPGHIACDSASRSEIVLPIYKKGALWGVLDIDSPSLNRFSQEDEQGLGKITEIISSTY